VSIRSKQRSYSITSSARATSVVVLGRGALAVFTVNHRLRFGWRLHWNIGRLGPKSWACYFCGTIVMPVGPMAVNCTITSPSFAHTKCGVPFGSEKNVPAE
jgi:hypothetical protein